MVSGETYLTLDTRDGKCEERYAVQLPENCRVSEDASKRREKSGMGEGRWGNVISFYTQHETRNLKEHKGTRDVFGLRGISYPSSSLEFE
ncbi:hypothetical protein E2C01_098703 [Portunus trituberculatus]|uniref:Uncharacterized protein n=1 Tax=Portunus trituberculatus TaxID=210409 RepID=A0A5B7K8X5_PORTR|nr:hypothetical protein [Portunus trituberculatus]